MRWCTAEKLSVLELIMGKKEEIRKIHVVGGDITDYQLQLLHTLKVDEIDTGHSHGCDADAILPGGRF